MKKEETMIGKVGLLEHFQAMDLHQVAVQHSTQTESIIEEVDSGPEVNIARFKRRKWKAQTRVVDNRGTFKNE